MIDYEQHSQCDSDYSRLYIQDDSGIYSLENLYIGGEDHARSYDSGEDGPGERLWLCADYCSAAWRCIADCLVRLFTIIMLIVFALYIALVWFPLDILFQGRNGGRHDRL